MSGDPIDIASARELVLAAVERLEAEAVPLNEALGRTLAEPATAAADVPGFDNSAMDGYAIRSEDVASAPADGPLRLSLAGESRAGAPAERAVEPGEAFAISTGAMLPAGADTVVRVEETSREGDEVLVQSRPKPGADIRRAGEDVRTGTVALEAGRTLGPGELGVLATVGVAEPACARRPRLAVLATGDELREPGEPLEPGTIHDSNAYAVPALGREAGAEPVLVGTVPDDAEATRERIAEALERADVVCVSGGVSVGEHDHVKEAFGSLGVTERFWRLAVRPGGPSWFGVGPRGQLAFGLPGNPVSAMVIFTVLVRPALLALQGAEPMPRRLEARLAASAKRADGRWNLVRVALAQRRDGGLDAMPTGPQGSHVSTSMLNADGLAFVEPGRGRAQPGEPVKVELLPAATLA